MKRIENKKIYLFQLTAVLGGSGALIGGSGTGTGSVGDEV
jgi:hypothetical protein